MTYSFTLAPRYRLDDESIWLEGIDPSRNYWIAVNGESKLTVAIAGLVAKSFEHFKNIILSFRALQAGETLTIERTAGDCVIHCVGQNCYAIADTVNGAPVWHLFDRETLESLLMTAHPNWLCSEKDLELGRKMLMRSWQQAVAA
ncbi:hypothetical protein V2H45_03675 [Tumidithrix elongata RA019]|uniref:Uncharacterized protein n=1 Tax=Tumidithrix elongata BACA0141 TaxID=2716417 RepID=A0AAW9PQX7_9CYAN|nr:hypothetical protein [Tumidithrix elongata RA019]